MIAATEGCAVARSAPRQGDGPGTEAQTSSSISGRAAGGWASLGLGAAALVGGVVLNMQARDQAEAADSAYDDFIASARTNLVARDEVRTATKEAENGAVASYVLFGVSAAFVATGAGLLLTDEGTVVTPAAGPTGAGVSLSGRW